MRRKACSIFAVSVVIGLSTFGTFGQRSGASSNQGPALNGWVSASNGLTGPPASQHSVWFGDINNDGKLDIATAGYEGIKVWAGDGAGNWYLNSTNLPTSSFDGGICLGDIDNDGKLDLAAANYDYGAPGVSVWRGNGAGVWTLASTGLPTYRGHTGIFMADINHDNNLDLAVSSDVFESNPGGVKVFTGNGAGVWTSASTGLPNADKYYAVWMGDVNNDGNMDLAAAGKWLHVWLGNGAGIWTESSTGLPQSDQWNSVAMGDINLDGNLDIVSAMDMGGHGLKAWLGDGRGNWSPGSSGLPTTGLYYGVAIADLVGDKSPDILAGHFGGGGIDLFKGNGGNSWIDASTGLPGGKVIGVAAGDIDNNGYIDIGAVGEGFGVQVFRNDDTTPPIKVAVTTPNGGENWEILTQHSVNWIANGGTPPLTIKIEYSSTGISGTYSTITSGEANDGTYTWLVPNSPSNSCFVRIEATDSTMRTNWGKSNLSFTIYLADPNPPTITNLAPPDGFVLADSTPTISADYSDASGIALASVTLKVDTVSVTSSAAVTVSGVTYTPSFPLLDGIHNIYLEVMDSYVAHNKATRSWSFTVDTLPPSVSNLQPLNQSTIGDSTPFISASYDDQSGVQTSSVMLKVDTIDVTASAAVTVTGVSYVPVTPMLDGVHDVYLELKDNSAPQNKATVTWWFNIDTTIPDVTPPTIGTLLPANFSYVGDDTPTISAAYGDSSGVNTAGVIMKVDSVDISSSATVTQIGTTYTPSVALAQGNHDVSVVVEDDSSNHNKAVATWSFRVDTLPPTIMSMDPTNQSTITLATPDIVGSYADASGIDTPTVLLKLDSVDVTGSSIRFSSDITYTPPAPLSLGRHDVYLSVSDNAVPHNTVIRTWWFIIDDSPPDIGNLQPLDQYITSIRTQTISASYSDPSGISLPSVVLTVDSVNVTASATVTPDDVTYVPATPFIEGVHNVLLEASDGSGLHHKATVSWQFTIDSKPPEIADLTPVNNSRIAQKRPVISANYSDSSGVNTGILMLRIDSIDVTSTATVTQTRVSFAFNADLADGLHNAILILRDNSYPPNQNSTQWFFTIDSAGPVIGHNQVRSGTGGQDIAIAADISDAAGIGEVSLYYRKTGGAQFTKVSMSHGTGNSWQASIPGSAVTTDGIEYYIGATDALGNAAHKPSSNWATSPYKIDVSAPSITDGFPWLTVALISIILIILIVLISILLSARKKKKEGGEEEQVDEG